MIRNETVLTLVFTLYTIRIPSWKVDTLSILLPLSLVPTFSSLDSNFDFHLGVRGMCNKSTFTQDQLAEYL